jgi:hypothetical protein
MAFIRKRGNSYYLVHSMRKKGRVRQIHLACLGRRPRISEDVIQDVAARHPFVKVDWQGLKEKATRDLIKPFENNSQFLQELAGSVRNLNLDIADLHLPVLQMTQDRELVANLTNSLRLLRSTLDVKLNHLGKGKSLPYAN